MSTPLYDVDAAYGVLRNHMSTHTPLMDSYTAVGKNLAAELMRRPGRDADTTADLMIELAGCLTELASRLPDNGGLICCNVIGAAAISIKDQLQ